MQFQEQQWALPQIPEFQEQGYELPQPQTQESQEQEYKLPLPQTPYRLGILVTDHNPVPAFTQQGGYATAYQDAFRRGCRLIWPGVPVESLFTILIYDVVTENRTYPSSDDVDAILITGSGASANDDDVWVIQLQQYVRNMYDRPLTQSVAILGSCFGHQIIAKALGGVVAANPNGWETGVETVELNPEGIQILGADELRIHQMHQDIVTIPPPPPISNLGSSAKCEIQILYQQDRLESVQGHPEFVEYISLATLQMLFENGKLNKKQLKRAKRRAEQEHDGNLFIIMFINVIHDACQEKQRLLQGAWSTTTTAW